MNLTANPLISVVMPVYNALPFLDESINSILEQTLSDFEFVILDDASTDGSVELLREWSLRDRRIHLYESKKRLGLSGSGNFKGAGSGGSAHGCRGHRASRAT